MSTTARKQSDEQNVIAVPPAGGTRSLWKLITRMLDKQHLILASNRGPVEYQLQPGGEMIARRGSGGVVTALSGLTNHVDFTWIASAMGEGDRKVAAQHAGKAVPSPLPGQRVAMRFIAATRRSYHKYYNIICNPLLWFLQHYMWSSPYTPKVDSAVYDAWDTGYVYVNRAFADAIINEAASSEKQPLIMVHDYHLYLVPGMVRAKLPEARIQHFTHIPWPAANYWQMLPAFMRTAICESLCNADIVGFQTERDVRSFLDSCKAFIEGADVDHERGTIVFNGRTTSVRSYPISIDVEEVRKIAASARAHEYDDRLQPMLGEQTIIRVDRAEPSKNILRGFMAYEEMLTRYPFLQGKVKYLAFLVPSRTHIRQYQRYQEEIEEQIRDINTKFGTEEWQPIQLFYENNYVQAIAAMRLYDVLVVNSVIDGMNLVAKEGPIVNARNGVLVLSEAAGAHEQLRGACLSVSPADVEGLVRAMYEALTMDMEERADRSRKLARSIEKEDIASWLFRQLQDVEELTEETLAA